MTTHTQHPHSTETGDAHETRGTAAAPDLRDTTGAQDAHRTTDHHLALTTLVSRYFRSLDELTAAGAGPAADPEPPADGQRSAYEDWARRFFTPDARTETPIGTVEGAAAIAEHTLTALGRFAATQHISADVLTEIDPAAGRAEVSWNALMTHVHRTATLERRGPSAEPLFTVGGHVRAEARLTEDGWVFSRMAIRALWHNGQPPILPPEVEAELAAAAG